MNLKNFLFYLDYFIVYYRSVVGVGVGGWEELIICYLLNFINFIMMFGFRRVFYGEVVYWIILFVGS